MATKLDRVVGSRAGLLSTNSHNLLIMWSNKVINSFSHDLWLSNMTEGLLVIRSNMTNHKVTYLFDQMGNRGQVTNELYYIITFRRTITTELRKVVAS